MCSKRLFSVALASVDDYITGGEEEEGSAIIDHGSSNLHGPNRPSAFSDGFHDSYNRFCPLWLRSRCNGTSFRNDPSLTDTEL